MPRKNKRKTEPHVHSPSIHRHTLVRGCIDRIVPLDLIFYLLSPPIVKE